MKVVVSTKEEINAEISNEIIELINTKKEPILGLATGSTPLGIYANLVKAYEEGKVSFESVRSFNLDEYVGLSEDNDQSYRYFMNANLFDKVDILKANTKVPTVETYEKYDSMIDEAGGIDFQILGIGSDGHIAFNEPGTPFDSITHIAELKESTIKDNSRFFARIEDVPTKSMTMGLASIMKARRVVLVAYGANKAACIKAMIEGPITEELPASILQNHPNVTVYCDKEAASLLTD